MSSVLSAWFQLMLPRKAGMFGVQLRVYCAAYVLLSLRSVNVRISVLPVSEGSEAL